MMNQEQINLNQNYKNEFNQQQNSKQKCQISDNENHKFLKKIGLFISIINFIYCLVSICIVTVIFFSELFNSKTGSSSGWFLLLVPIIIGVYILAYVPDGLCLIFSFLNNSKNKKKYSILIIAFSVIGCMVMNSGLLTEILTGFGVLRLIYTIFKIILILFNMIVLILFKKVKN